MLFTEEDTIVGDLVNSTVRYLKSGKKIDFSENRNDYQKKELVHFLSLLYGTEHNNYIYEAYNTMKYSQVVK